VCSPTNTLENYRISDSAHETGQVFQEAHEAFLTAFTDVVAIGLHGFEQNTDTGEPFVVASDGTDNPDIDQMTGESDPNNVANRFTTLFNSGSTIPDAAWSCNDGGLGPTTQLCANHDVQGRFANLSANTCSSLASSSTGRFLHIEQSGDIRSPGGNFTPANVIQALQIQFPEEN